jgi:hypothetical protein
MQSENFDQKIKDALSQPPPGNENPTWDRMETILDKHMPQKKKDRRRFFLIFFIFLLAGGAGYFIWNNGSRNKTEISSSKPLDQNIKQQQPTDPSVEKRSTELTAEKQAVAGSTKQTTIVNSQTPQENVTNQATTNLNSRQEVNKKSFNQNISEKGLPIKNASVNRSTKTKNIPDQIISNKIPNKKSDNAPIKETVAENKTNTPNTPQKQDEIIRVTEKNDQLKNGETPKQEDGKKVTEIKSELKESQPTPTVKSKPGKQKTKSSFLNNIFFSVSMGPDITTVGIDKIGKARLATGVGVGYQISKKFSIRTGFYSASKVYTADPEDYHPPYNVVQYYPNLKTIDANCKVYEIPVMFDYTISNNKKGSWFVAAGVSSLIMKKEKYEYYFKPNYSPTYVTYTRTINNENKHYFSQLNIAGGYTKNINKNFSLRAEPYMKIAMGGVGFGKVKLNSGGVQFSAIVKPFAKR